MTDAARRQRAKANKQTVEQEQEQVEILTVAQKKELRGKLPPALQKRLKTREGKNHGGK